MRTWLLAVILVSATALSFGAEPCKYVAVDLGNIKPETTESAPGPALFKAIADHPGCEVVAVNFGARVNDQVADHKRFFYESRQKLLVLLTRSSMQGLADNFAWRIWHNVKPADFKDRMPYGRDDLKTTASPWESPKVALAQAYKGPKEATVWP